MPRIFRYAAILSSLALMYACSSDSNNFPTTQLVVDASLGQVTGATVTMLQPDGTPLTGATGTTGTDGRVTIAYNAGFSGPYVVQVSGNPDASYFDEASQTTVPFPAGQSIRAIGSSPSGSVGVTILTELAAQVADSVGSGITAADIDTINESIRVAFAPDVASILTPPVIIHSGNISSQSLGTDDASRYALRLAALAGIAAGSEAPALAILQQLSADLADGALDGNGPDGAIANLAYGTRGFAAAFSDAIALAATSLANTDLSAVLESINVSTSGNLLQRVIDGGVSLPSSVTDAIQGAGGALGSGNFNLTVSGNISTAGIATPFSLQLNGVPAPTPGDTDAINTAISSSVAGLDNIADLNISVVNNTASQITFDVTLTAEQAGTSVTLALRYDYVSTGGSSNPDSSGGTDGDTTGGGTSGGGTTGGGTTGGSGNFCFQGEPTPTTIPASFVGTVFSLTFTAGQPGSPFTDGDQRDFLVSSSGALFINDVAVAENPVLCGGNEREAVWKDSTQDLTYSLSDLSASFNEFNIARASDKAFLGQFKIPATAEPAGPPAALTALAGTFTTQVVESCSGTNCPNSTAVGETVSVIIGTDGTVTFADLQLNSEATDARFLDLTDRSDSSYLLTNKGTEEGDSLELTIHVDAGAPVAFRLKQAASCGSGCSSSKNLYTEVVPLPDNVVAFFDKFIALMPTTLTVVTDSPDFSGGLRSFTKTSNTGNMLCRTFELSAAKDRSAVQSSRNRPQFAYFVGNSGGADYQRAVSRLTTDAATSDETLSFFNSQLVVRGDGTIDLEEGFREGTTGTLTSVLDRATNDAAEITSACADFKSIDVSITSTTNGSANIELVDTGTGETSQTASVSLNSSAAVATTFVLGTGISYEVKVTFTSPSSLSCTVSNGTGTVAAANITDVAIACQ